MAKYPQGTLTRREGLQASQLEELLNELNRCSVIPYVPPEHFRYLIATIDDDGSGAVSWREFYDFLDTLQFSYQRVRKVSAMQRYLKDASTMQHFFYHLKVWTELPPGEGWGLERIMMVVMVLNAISVVIEISEDYYDLEDLDPSQAQSAPNPPISHLTSTTRKRFNSIRTTYPTNLLCEQTTPTAAAVRCPAAPRTRGR